MRFILLSVCVLAATSVSAGETTPDTARVVVRGDGPPDRPGEIICRDRISQARAANGQPMLERRTASPDEPLFIAAVDQRIDGCSMLVMRNDTSDVRPIPRPPESAGMIPAN